MQRVPRDMAMRFMLCGQSWRHVHPAGLCRVLSHALVEFRSHVRLNSAMANQPSP